MTAIVDTGVFFAFYSLKDKHHLDSIALIIHLIDGKWGRGFITNHILDETLNILKYKLSHDAAKAFIETFIEKDIIRIINTDVEIEKRALEIFMKNIHRKGFSYTDAVTVAVIKEYDIDYLLSFDLRSFSKLVNNVVGSNYWEKLSIDERKRISELISKIAGYYIKV